MELYALYEIGVVRVEVKTVNINSEAFKKSFLGAQPPIMVENKFVPSCLPHPIRRIQLLKILSDIHLFYFRNATYTDNREIEGRIFHLAKEFNVPLFEKDPVVEKRIESLYRVSRCYEHGFRVLEQFVIYLSSCLLGVLFISFYRRKYECICIFIKTTLSHIGKMNKRTRKYFLRLKKMLSKNMVAYKIILQNFKIFLRSKSDHDREQKGSSPTPVESLPPQQKASYNKLVEQLANIDQVK